jgi:hypothetical protein
MRRSSEEAISAGHEFSETEGCKSGGTGVGSWAAGEVDVREGKAIMAGGGGREGAQGMELVRAKRRMHSTQACIVEVVCW